MSDRELLESCEVDRFRASGPGGQKRNKTDSAVRVRHVETGIAGLATESRSQHENRARALSRLRTELALQWRESFDILAAPPSNLIALLAGVGPGPRSKAGKVDRLLGLARLLDAFVASECSLRDTAERLGCSTAALSRLLVGDARLLRKVNELRAERGLRSLRGR